MSDYVITEKTVKQFRKKLAAYVKKEEPFRGQFQPRTHLLDILFFLGLSIDENKFNNADGFDRFKELLKKEITDTQPRKNT